MRAALAAMRRGENYVRAIADDDTELLHANALTAAWPALSGAVAADDALAALRADLEQLEGAHLVQYRRRPSTSTQKYPGEPHRPLSAGCARERGRAYSHASASRLVDA
ncbi:MAG: hypothetical protein IPH23_14940 [Gammaproteobacteria bacterium]|nr:hypothetical protein [Gammaproteobacteria bacterium]